MTVAAPSEPGQGLVAVASAAPGAHAVSWSPFGGDESYAGVGALRVVRAAGPNRFAEIDRGVRATMRDAVELDGAAGEAVSSSRWFGGFAFEPEVDVAGPWASFGAAAFVLHRRAWIERGGRAWELRRALVAPGDGADAVVENLGAGADSEADPCEGWATRGDESRRFSAAVRAALDAIADGDVEKVVLARALAWRIADANPARIVPALRAAYPSAAVFWFGGGRGVAFCGATPERLVQVRGDHASTMALAGTARADRAHELLGSSKDRAEHRVVVDEVRGALASIAASVEAGDAPDVLRVGELVHLHTPISARLRAGTRGLDVAAALHPTPAVGGRPRDRALDLIARCEAGSRGWYAAPVGWITADGDVELAVALRSALVRGDRAIAFAGAGIVAGSDPEAELDETRWKAEPMRDVLGAEPLGSARLASLESPGDAANGSASGASR